MIAQLVTSVMDYTMTSPKRVTGMALALLDVDERKIEGDVVECGVWRGGNIILARKVSPARRCWLYDTFAGMTKPGPLDNRRRSPADVEDSNALAQYERLKAAGRGWCQASLEDVRENLRATGTLDEAKLRFIVGDVEETLKVDENLPESIAILRLDTDWYASTKIELEVLYPRLAPGGILIVDDYGHWQGARQAVDEYFAGQTLEFFGLDYTAIRITKPCSM